MTKPTPVFFVSDGTGITAETLGNTLLTQFDGLEFDKASLPFVNTAERAQSTVDYINFVGDQSGQRPLVFSTTVNDEARPSCVGLRSVPGYVRPLHQRDGEAELQVRSPRMPRAAPTACPTSASTTIAWTAISYAMEHDDGASTRDLSRADLILIAPSRCGKARRPACTWRCSTVFFDQLPADRRRSAGDASAGIAERTGITLLRADLGSGALVSGPGGTPSLGRAMHRWSRSP